MSFRGMENFLSLSTMVIMKSRGLEEDIFSESLLKSRSQRYPISFWSATGT